jgi:hypothetical protein
VLILLQKDALDWNPQSKRRSGRPKKPGNAQWKKKLEIRGKDGRK